MLSKQQIGEYIQPLAVIPTALSQSGRVQSQIKAVFFDIYGTLLISDSGDIGATRQKEARIIKVLDALSQKYRIAQPSAGLLENFYRTIESAHRNLKAEGIDFPEIEIDRIWMTILKGREPETVKEFAVEFELMVNPVYPMPHALELLKALKKKQILLGIISNAQFFTPRVLEWLLGSLPDDLGFHPTLQFYSYRHGHAKPSRVLFDMAGDRLEEMNVAIGEALYVGNDMLNDIYPAQLKGFKTALFAGDRRSLRLRRDDPRCTNLSADLVITDLIQLLDSFD